MEDDRSKVNDFPECFGLDLPFSFADNSGRLYFSPHLVSMWCLVLGELNCVSNGVSGQISPSGESISSEFFLMFSGLVGWLGHESSVRAICLCFSKTLEEQ